jgi:DmsE family decaheme c-type cytochrome
MRHTSTILDVAASCLLALSCTLAFSPGLLAAEQALQPAKAHSPEPKTARLTADQVAQPVNVHAGSSAAARLTVAQVTTPMKVPAGHPVTGAVCAECHESESKTHIFHGECTACHVNATSHAAAESPRRESPGLPKPEQCLACHQSGERMHWKGSGHDTANVECTSCHVPHAQSDPVLTKATEAEVCFACHKGRRAEMLRPSTHPLREGKMSCSDCHNPHGSNGPKLLTKETVNETCFTCHAEKRGPFLFEHAPVREDCGICHRPHGSVNASLLKNRTPWLCQQCHLAAQHPSTAFSGTGLPGTNKPSGAQQLLGKSCMNCHSQVHGSNHPSGMRKTR